MVFTLKREAGHRQQQEHLAVSSTGGAAGLAISPCETKLRNGPRENGAKCCVARLQKCNSRPMRMKLTNTFDAKPSIMFGAGCRPSRGPLTYDSPGDF